MLLARIIALLKSKGYTYNSRVGELNIVGIRSDSTTSGKFDDELHVFYKTNSVKWDYHVFKITTDPGTYWLKNPFHVDGTAILATGQYTGAYAIGLHKGQYKALVQRKPVTVIRDYDRNAVLDFNNGKAVKGLFGINIHHASANGTTKDVGRWSAGCQVFDNITAFNTFMKLCEAHRKKYGNQFTYTLIDLRALKRAGMRFFGYGAGTVLLGLITYYLYQ